jgi:hypothetical protein
MLEVLGKSEGGGHCCGQVAVWYKHSDSLLQEK